MAGIYIHVPFCKKKCRYCDFYSNTFYHLADQLIKCEIGELVIRKDYLQGEAIHSVYFGGGTPSMLSLEKVENILDTIRKNYSLAEDAEITFECNPDDLDRYYLEGLAALGINRISLGVQSFNDDVLLFLNRRHNALQAENSIQEARRAGIQNISVDLIFGIPYFDNKIYENSLLRLIDFQVEHISAYSLTFEPGTIFYKQIQRKKLVPLNEEDTLHQFSFTIDQLKERGYAHYEISNYARQGKESQHNQSYWNHSPYLGIGPSAHSYDGNSRQWNVANTAKYIQSISNHSSFFEREILSEENKYNEYMLTKLRTAKGISEDYIKNNFNNYICNHFKFMLQKVIDKGYMVRLDSGNFTLNRKGIFLLDFIVEMFYYNKK